MNYPGSTNSYLQQIYINACICKPRILTNYGRVEIVLFLKAKVYTLIFSIRKVFRSHNYINFREIRWYALDFQVLN